MTSPFKAQDSGLLLVFMRPGAHVSLAEFHEWYDSEHVPLRIRRFDTFRSAARYAVTSTGGEEGGEWGAFYTISSNAVFADTSYTSLRSERSEREAELFTRLGLVDRRIYRLVYDSDADEKLEVERKRLGLRVQREVDTGEYLVTNSVDMIDRAAQEEYDRWFEQEHVPMLSKVPGWKRSRRFVLVDNGVNGREAKEGMAESVPKVLGLHEYERDGIESTPEYKSACDTEWRTKVLGEQGEKLVRRERKTCALYRAWDPVAAIEAEEEEGKQQ